MYLDYQGNKVSTMIVVNAAVSADDNVLNFASIIVLVFLKL
jgi:hypothetical protein